MQFGAFEIFTSAYLSKLHKKNHVINNVYEKISRRLSRRNARVSHNQGKIAPSRACAWFESKRFDWPSVSFFDHWPIRTLGLLPVCTCQSFLISTFCTNLVFLHSKNFKFLQCLGLIDMLSANQNGEIFHGITVGGIEIKLVNFFQQFLWNNRFICIEFRSVYNQK